jgi:hypothetical protein
MYSEAWNLVVDRLSREAARRGGEAIEDPDTITLRPPQDSGETIHATLYHDGTYTDLTVMIETGFAYRLAVGFNDDEAPDDVVGSVVAVMDGYATEVAEVAEDGTWLNIASTLDQPGSGNRRSTRYAPVFRLTGAPVDHEHVRHIDPWPRSVGHA